MVTSPARLTDSALLAEVKRLARCEREIVATLVAHLVEVEARELFHAEGCSSMFKYCTEVLRFSEDAAMVRLQATRAARQHSIVIEDLASGALSLSSLRLLAPHLTFENAPELIAASRHKSKREVEKLVRERFPLPDVPAVVRRLPSKAPVDICAVDPEMASAGRRNVPTSPVPRGTEALPPQVTVAAVLGELLSQCATSSEPGVRRSAEPAPRPNVIAPLAPERYKVQFTASASLHATLRRAQDLLRHRIPSGDLSQVFELALEVLVEKLEKQRYGATDRPRSGRAVAVGSRVIPAEVKRTVYKRDGGRCAFVGKDHRRCSETGFLEFHHLVPFARGGEATVTNIALRCRSHNQYEARLDFGRFGPPTVRESSAPWGTAVREGSVLQHAGGTRTAWGV